MKNTCQKKKIGILGGTFNPIHIGHLIIAENAYDEFDLDEVWIMPAFIPPHKRNDYILDDELRLKMVQYATLERPYFKTSDYEIQKEDVSYTAETLKSLSRIYPEYEYYFIVGADSLLAIDTWYHPEVIFRYATVLAAVRDDADTDMLIKKAEILKQNYQAKIYIMSVPKVDISSTMIRRRVACGQTINYFVPDKVRDYIYENHLYTGEDS